MRALLNEAHTKLRLKSILRFVPEEIDAWESRDFLAVTTRDGHEGVLIVPFITNAILPFRLQKRTPNSTGRTEPIICDICATWQRGSNSAAITFSKGHSSVSFLCCADLACSLHVRNLTLAAKLSRTQLKEDMSTDERIKRLIARLTCIVHDVM